MLVSLNGLYGVRVFRESEYGRGRWRTGVLYSVGPIDHLSWCDFPFKSWTM